MNVVEDEKGSKRVPEFVLPSLGGIKFEKISRYYMIQVEVCTEAGYPFQRHRSIARYS